MSARKDSSSVTPGQPRQPGFDFTKIPVEILPGANPPVVYPSEDRVNITYIEPDEKEVTGRD